ncbi:MAG: hypothetical protein AAGC55_26815, partial [Myxococcota bacterium]
AALWTGLPERAHAQMAGALGKPLPVSNLPDGTVTVRVIAGSPSKPLAGIGVTLVAPDNTERAARTDAEGRATFANLKPGSQYVARAEEPAEGQTQEPRRAQSEGFTIPDKGGIRLLLSTRPWDSGAAAPAAGGGAPMLDPRRMSGIPRREMNDRAGTLTISAVRGVVTNKIADQPIHLIGYGSDGSVTRTSTKTDEGGRAVFEGLTREKVAYYAFTTYNRELGDRSVVDRVRGRAVVLPLDVGVRLMLAGHPADSRNEAIEDMNQVARQGTRAPGEILVRIFGPGSGTAVLYEIAEGDKDNLVKVAEAPIGTPLPADVQVAFGDVAQRGNDPTGSLQVAIAQNGRPMPGVQVEVVPLAAPAADSAASGETPAAPSDTTPATPGDTAPAAPAPLRTTSDIQGLGRLTGLSPGSRYRVALTIAGQRFDSAPFEVPQSGGLGLSVNATWQQLSNSEARFTGVAADKIYLVEVTNGDTRYRSAPLLTIADRGAAL